MIDTSTIVSYDDDKSDDGLSYRASNVDSTEALGA